MHISTMLVFWSLFSLVRNSVVLAVYLLFSVACFFTVHEHYLRGCSSRSQADTEKVSALKVPEKPLPPSSILTLSADAEIETPASIEDTNWHELQNAFRTKKSLPELLAVLKNSKPAERLRLSIIKSSAL